MKIVKTIKTALLVSILLFAKYSQANIPGLSGIASWYGPGFQGRKTASGARFNTHAMTAAHKHLPLGTVVKVTNLYNDRSVVVTITDRGPFVRGRILDLTHAAKTQIAMGGTAPVHIQILE